MKRSLLLATGISLISFSILPSIAMERSVDQFSEEQKYALELGFNFGVLKTICGMFELGVLSEQEVKDFEIGYSDSIKEREKGASLDGAMRGYEMAVRPYPNCPLPRRIHQQ